MKYIGSVVLLLLSTFFAAVLADEQPVCKVAATCTYKDGRVKAQFRRIPHDETPTIPPEIKCPDDGWFNGLAHRQYKIIGQLASWANADEECQKEGAHLINHGARHKDAYEVILEGMLYNNPDKYGYWLPLSYHSEEGKWLWDDGSEMTEWEISMWATNQPDGSGNCAYIGRDWDNYHWDDGVCENEQFLLCERLCI